MKYLVCAILIVFLSAAFSTNLFAESIPSHPSDVIKFKKKLRDLTKFSNSSKFNEFLLKEIKDLSHLSVDEIQKRDQKWQETYGIDEFILTFLTNDLAELLKHFQEKHHDFIEIFVTDKRGLLIASTNKTSDYFQADEIWWKQIANASETSGYWGSLEYDASTQSLSIPFYVRVTNPKTNELIGIIKAVCYPDYNRKFV